MWQFIFIYSEKIDLWKIEKTIVLNEDYKPYKGTDFLIKQMGWCVVLRKNSLFSRSVVSDSSWPHGLQHTRLPCPSLSPGVCSNLCPSSWWYHPTISSSVALLPLCFQPFPASGSFLMSQFFTSGGQSIGASASILPMNIQGWFPLGLTGLILQSEGLWSVFFSTRVQKHQYFCTQPSLWCKLPNNL